MTAIEAAILGIVEGITEFLPISSTGHLILTARLLGIAPTDFTKSFEIIIQLGAILAVIILYFRRLVLDTAMLKRVLIAFIPTGVLGLVFYRLVKTYLLGNSTVVIWSLLIGGVILIAFERANRNKQEWETGERGVRDVSYRDAFLLGVVQSFAMIPGISRAAATIIGALGLGYNRKTAVEFSFLLAIPTMLAASGLDIAKSADAFNGSQFAILGVGFIVSFIVALATVLWLLKFIRNHTFTGFGVYRILAALAFFVFIK